MIPPNGVVDNVPPDERCKVLYGEVKDEQWDKNDKKVVAGSDATYILVKWGGHYSSLVGSVSQGGQVELATPFLGRERSDYKFKIFRSYACSGCTQTIV